MDNNEANKLIYISRNFNKSLDPRVAMRRARIYISRNFNKSLDQENRQTEG